MPSFRRRGGTRTETKPTAPLRADDGKAQAPVAAGAATAAGAKTAPAPNVQERIEGLQSWMAEIERKQGRMTYFGAAALLIAILASGAALYFGITAKNDSSGATDDLDELSTKVDQVQQAVTQSTKDTQDTINNSISQIQGSIADLQKKQAQDAANISTLQSQVASGALSQGGAATPGTTTTTPTPTPGTTTTKKP